jgi:hypothetical protein
MMIERFCEAGKIASRREELQRIVRNGRRVSICSWMRKVGRGSSSDDLAGEARMRRHSSASVTGARVEKESSVEENEGGRESAVSRRTASIFVAWKLAYSSAENGGGAGDEVAPELSSRSLKVNHKRLGSPELDLIMPFQY